MVLSVNQIKMLSEFRKRLSKERFDFNNYLLSFNERRLVLKMFEIVLGE